MRIIKSNDEEYKCYENLETTISGHQEINESLAVIRGFCSSLVEMMGPNEQLILKVYAYEADEVNAFAIKQNEEYCIGISVETFRVLKQWFNTWMNFDKTYDVLNLHYRKKETIIYIMYNYSLLFLAMHECFHILFGHCDCPYNMGKFLFEQSKQTKQEDALFEQSLETSADTAAIIACVVKMMNEDKSQEVWEEKSRILLFTVYSVFKIFSEYECYDFDEFIEDDLYKYDHPHAGLRFKIVIRVLDYSVKFLKEKNLDAEIINEYIRFEKEILEIESLKKMLTSIAYTSKGSEHIKTLLQKWNDVRESFEPYAHMPLLNWAEIGQSPILINNKGELIRCTEEMLNIESA